jgi:hypothetical protein
MLRPWGLVIVLASIPALARAGETAPEALLSSRTQLYLRWDGADAHRAARDKSALGKTLREDAGTFLVNLLPQVLESIGRGETTRLLKQGVQAGRLEKAQADAALAPRLPDVLARHGFVVAAEVRSVLPPDVQASLILPGAGANAGPFFSAIRLYALANNLEVKAGTFAGRSVQYLDFSGVPTPVATRKPVLGNRKAAVKAPAARPGAVYLAWWVEGTHAVLALGTQPPEALVHRLQEKGPRLTDKPLFQRVRAFKEFETGIRGFIDAASLVQTAGGVPFVSPILDAWGLRGFKSAVLHMGFDGEFTRTVAELEMQSPRKGILRAFGGKPFSLADLPPVPPDAQQFVMLNLNLPDVLDAAGEALASLPGGAAAFQEYLKAVNEALDVNVRTDLLGSLGQRAVVYSSPADGVLFSQVALIEVKEPRKLTAGLDRALKSLQIGGSIRVKKRSFRGTDIRQIYLKGATGFPYVPAVAVYKKWLVVAFSPQGVQGFILRATGELPAWKPEPQVEAALARLPKQFTLLSVSDPRPTVRQGLAIVPLAVSFASQVPGGGEPVLDVGTLPNTHLAVKHLFPNTMVWTDDGTRVRIDSRGSLELPFGFTGLDSYGILAVSLFFRFGA